MRFETRTSRLLLTLATLVTSRVAHAAQDARPVAPPAWDLASVREIEGGHQIGVLFVGTDDETNAGARASALIRRKLEASGHEVKALEPAARMPARAVLADACLTFGIDAVVLVRISPPAPAAGGGRAIRLQVMNRHGDVVRLRPDIATSWRDPVVTEMALPDPSGVEAEAAPPIHRAPQLRIAGDGQYLGSARLRRAEIYDLTGHPEMAELYRRRLKARIAVQVGGYVLVGAGVTALAAVELGSGLCGAASELIATPFGGRSTPDKSCDPSPWAIGIPIGVAVAGGVTLALSGLIHVDPVDAEGRAALVRAYNQQVQESERSRAAPPAAPSATLQLTVTPALLADGGLLLMNGRF